MNTGILNLINSKFHLGAFKREFNAEMVSYVSGSRFMLHIISLAHSILHLQKALFFLKLASRQRALTLFILRPDLSGTAFRVPFFVSKWVPGILSNFFYVSRYYKRRHHARLFRIPEIIVFLPTLNHDAFVANEGQTTRTPCIFLTTSTSNVFGSYPIPGNSFSSGAAKFLYDISINTIKKGQEEEKFNFLKVLREVFVSGADENLVSEKIGLKFKVSFPFKFALIAANVMMLNIKLKKFNVVNFLSSFIADRFIFQQVYFVSVYLNASLSKSVITLKEALNNQIFLKLLSSNYLKITKFLLNVLLSTSKINSKEAFFAYQRLNRPYLILRVLPYMLPTQWRSVTHPWLYERLLFGSLFNKYKFHKINSKLTKYLLKGKKFKFFQQKKKISYFYFSFLPYVFNNSNLYTFPILKTKLDYIFDLFLLLEHYRQYFLFTASFRTYKRWLMHINVKSKRRSINSKYMAYLVGSFGFSFWFSKNFLFSNLLRSFFKKQPGLSIGYLRQTLLNFNFSLTSKLQEANDLVYSVREKREDTFAFFNLKFGNKLNKVFKNLGKDQLSKLYRQFFKLNMSVSGSEKFLKELERKDSLTTLPASFSKLKFFILQKMIGPYFAYISYFYMFFNFFGTPNFLSNKFSLSFKNELFTNVFCLRNPFFARASKHLLGKAQIWEKNFHLNSIYDIQQFKVQNYNRALNAVSTQMPLRRLRKYVRRKKGMSKESFLRRFRKLSKNFSHFKNVQGNFIGVSAWSIFNSIVFLDKSANYTIDRTYNFLKKSAHLEKTFKFLSIDFFLKAKKFKL